jgi:uncharacterized protein (TIGR02246 family)
MFRQSSARSAVQLIQSAEAAASPAKGKRSAEQQAPESIVKNLVLAWNRGDSEAVAGLFLPDGILIIPTGSVIHSRSAIRKRILDERQGRLKESVLSNTVEDVSLVDANTALVRGKYVLDGMKVMGVKTSPEGSYILRQRKQQGTWKIAKAEVLGKK